MKKLKVLMFGWEFPPFNSGGLGVACYGLTKALAKQGVEVIFVLPKKINCSADFCRIIFADENPVDAEKIISAAYLTPDQYGKVTRQLFMGARGLVDEVVRYGLLARQIAEREDFDIIHSHDWLCYPAGIAAKEVSGKPLVAHIHATEFDRTGGTGVNQQVYAIEKQGFETADRITAVSDFTRQKVVEYYGINPAKVKVVHNALERERSVQNFETILNLSGLKEKFKIVLFLGRLTLQKGPDYFLRAAAKVLEKSPDVYFIMAGSGDMEAQLINQSIDLGIADRVIFTGFLRDQNLARVYQMADLYVMPSVSEPFGLTALEALGHGTPVIISKQSGVSEVIKNCLRVDFWDINQMAGKILAVLNYPVLKNTLKENGAGEVEKITWDNSAVACLNIYNEILS
ncbi:MAG: glycosyltransferase family 4 protein [Candidatus Pacebacteria bacterium]|nr:glycosyltransferase family 4 protein [Candidatus Paceibacterota bacterium]